MTWEQQVQTALKATSTQNAGDFARISRAEAAFMAHTRLVVKVRLFLFSVVFAVSCLAFIYTGLDALAEAGRTGFTDVVRLAVSDWSVVAQQWQTFTISLIELLPSLSLTGVLLGLVGMLVSLGYINLYGKRVYLKTI